jgi:hypothetical protein
MEGYNSIAGLLGSYPEIAMYRSFGAIGARNILCLQAEVIHLEATLLESIAADRASDDPDRRASIYEIYALEQLTDDGTRKRTFELTVELRAKLKEYC